MRLSRQSCNGIKPNNTHIYNRWKLRASTYYRLYSTMPSSSVPVLPISERKALHVPTQSFATANAKLCNCQRKALHLPTQSFASAHAKLCIRLRKALLEKAPSFRIIYFMTVNAKHCDYPCKRILVNALLFRNPFNFRNKSILGFLDKN